ncbi:MAG TPA: RsmE family RNA methyltransferase [Phycisphaerae bacterium]|nr:RsmE family RNA methyltransferase [Phycisphaerae bacterium]
MSEPRFYCPALAVGVVTLDETETRHALATLRLRPGDRLVVFDGQGRVGKARLLDQDRPSAAQPSPGDGPRNRRARHTGGLRGKAHAHVSVETVLSVPPPTRRLTLIVAPAKGPRLDWMVEKCTELGVDRLLLTAFERSVVRLEAAAAERLRRIAIAACKQSRRAWLPELCVAPTLAAALGPDESRGPGEWEGIVTAIGQAPRTVVLGAALLVADPDESAAFLAAWLHSHGPPAAHLTVVIGPEGGLTATERERLRAAGGQTVRLAEPILRTETAAVSVAANWAARAH